MKIIIRPSQCAARTVGPRNVYCTVNGSVFLPCPSMFKFPNKCPLPNATSIPLTDEDMDKLVELSKEQIGLAPHMTATSKCIHYFGSYKCDLRTGKINDHCVGKTCGNYEIKT